MMVLSKVLPVMQLLFYRSKISVDLVYREILPVTFLTLGELPVRIEIRPDLSHNLVACLPVVCEN